MTKIWENVGNWLSVCLDSKTNANRGDKVQDGLVQIAGVISRHQKEKLDSFMREHSAGSSGGGSNAKGGKWSEIADAATRFAPLLKEYLPMLWKKKDSSKESA